MASEIHDYVPRGSLNSSTSTSSKNSNKSGSYILTRDKFKEYYGADISDIKSKNRFKGEESDSKIKKILKEADYAIDDDGTISAVIPFTQRRLINAKVYGNDPLPKNLKKFVVRFDGLCELICNKVLIDDALGKDVDEDFHIDNITVEALQKPEVINSHMLDVYSVFHKMLAFLSKKYPHNIFSYKDQRRLVTKKANAKIRIVNKSLLKSGLENIDSGATLKMEVFSKGKFHFSGHSLLIKKVDDDEFIFFDPNRGEYRGLTFKELVKKINEQIKVNQGTDILISKGSVYLKKLEDKKILQVAKQTISSEDSSTS